MNSSSIHKKPKLENSTIHTIDISGAGVGITNDGKPIHVWGALPSESVIARITKKRPMRIGVVEEILKKSPDRILPCEDHYLSCSPWQIVSFEKENEWKSQLLASLFHQNDISIPEYNFHTGSSRFGYRNKMEFSFFQDDETLSFAFHARGSRGRIPLTSCILADAELMECSSKLLDSIRSIGIPRFSLKTLLLRCNQAGNVVAGLFVTDKEARDYESLFTQSGIQGLNVFFSEPKSPASVPTESLESYGTDTLTENIFGTQFTFSLLSFLQVNIPLFEQALSSIHRHTSHTAHLIDAYAGIGTIGLTSQARKITLIESLPEATEYAKKNADRIGRSDVEILTSPLEKLEKVFEQDALLVLDPPRSGLHPDVIKALKITKPHKIIYLSCNPVTQVRDITLLQEYYSPTSLEGFNFFPATPHIESLVVLIRTQ